MLLESVCRREFVFILSISKGVRPCGAREGDKGRLSGLLKKISRSVSMTCMVAVFQLKGCSKLLHYPRKYSLLFPPLHSQS